MTTTNAGLFGAETIFGEDGAAAISTPVTVLLTGTEDSATLYTDNTMATTASNPVDTDDLGNLSFWAAPGVYDLSFTVGGDPTTITVQVDPYVNDSVIPTGVIWPFVSDTIPAGWLLCDGSAVSRTTYAVLFGLVAETFGAGDGSTTFNLPNIQSRTIVGASAVAVSDGLTQRTIGTTGGEETHLLAAGESGAAPHSHSYTEPNGGDGHRHGFTLDNQTEGNGTTLPVGTNDTTQEQGVYTGYSTTGITIENSTDPGASEAHNNMQPFIALYHIIKA